VGLDSRASVGLAIARTPAEFDSLLRRADTALYTAKEDGKGRWRQYEEGMVSPVRRRTDLRVELEDAMRDRALTLNYQPIVDLATGRVAGFEALLRLHRGDLAPMPPEELIRIAEENGLIASVGDWVIEQALSDLARLNPPDLREPRYVSLNVSPLQLRQPDFVAKVRERLRRFGVDPRQLVLEITERLLVPEDAQAWGFLAELRGDGVRVAIDDYGTGYASLSYLRQPAIDIVKIDRSFLNDLGAPNTRLLLAAVVRLCASLGLAQVAEGIEVPQARDMLRELGCRYGQGYLYAPALPVDEAAGWGRPGAELSRSA
jgi:EAL domain-containing protein (putative c-di-GMP-specific phosphodiesterase class I)